MVSLVFLSQICPHHVSSNLPITVHIFLPSIPPGNLLLWLNYNFLYLPFSLFNFRGYGLPCEELQIKEVVDFCS